MCQILSNYLDCSGTIASSKIMSELALCTTKYSLAHSDGDGRAVRQADARNEAERKTLENILKKRPNP